MNEFADLVDYRLVYCTGDCGTELYTNEEDPACDECLQNTWDETEYDDYSAYVEYMEGYQL
jgi:hypothetical protein